MRRTGPASGVWAIALTALAVLSMACQGGSAGPAVAQVSSTPSASPSGASGILAFAACMRSDGIPNFPDSGKIQPAMGIDPDSPQFQAAQKACTSLLPHGGGTVRAADQARFLEFSACMRSHGVPSFPDPVFPAGGGVWIGLPSGMDPNSPQLNAGNKACDQYLSGRGPRTGGSHARSGGGASP